MFFPHSAGTLCDEDGKLFIKPCTQKEVDFYQAIQREASNPDPSKEKYRELQSIMPKFMGTLTLTDPADEKIEEAVTGVISQAGGVETEKQQMSAAVTEQIAKATPAGHGKAAEGDWVPTNGGKIKTNTAIVLDNASLGFKKANILDLKMGVRLHADNAPAKKKQKMDKITQETTHKTHGFRVAGMRVYRGSEDGAELDDDGFMIYDKDYGRNTVTSENVTSEISKFVFNKPAGIDKELAKAVCRGLAHQVEEVEATLSKFETRMFSASLLIVLEGDGKTLSKAIDQNNAAVDAVEAAELDWTTKRVDSGIVLDDDGEFGNEALAPMFKVRLIDFAHAELKEPGSTSHKTESGDDPHESLLMGVRSVKQIFEELGRD